MIRTPLSLALAAALLCAAPLAAVAKLPPLSPEAKAKADETKAKTAHTDKVAAYKLCQSMDRTAAHYFKTAKASGKDVKPATETPACADPGPFVYTPPESKPIEAAGAHSPAGTASTPPSTTQPAASAQPTIKKP